MMVQGHRYLDQSLQELLLRLGGGAPDVFERLMGLKKVGAIEELDPLPTWLKIHSTLWHRGAGTDPQ